MGHLLIRQLLVVNRGDLSVGWWLLVMRGRVAASRRGRLVHPGTQGHPRPSLVGHATSCPTGRQGVVWRPLARACCRHRCPALHSRRRSGRAVLVGVVGSRVSMGVVAWGTRPMMVVHHWAVRGGRGGNLRGVSLMVNVGPGLVLERRISSGHRLHGWGTVPIAHPGSNT